MSFDDDFEDIFGDFDFFRLMRRSQNELEKMLKRIRSGEIEGTWEVREIDEPSMKGYAIRGHFGTENPLQPLDPIEPLKPSKRRPLPEKPFEISKSALKEMREPLIDIFEDENAAKVYIELPGVEKEDIKLNFNEGCVEVRAKNFFKNIELPNKHVFINKVTTEYKNGVLELTLPKKKRLRNGDAKNLKAV